MNRVLLIVLAVSALALVVAGGFVASAYNGLVAGNQAVVAQWAQVENVYQRRADLVPNLVETVKGAAGYERDTLTAVTEARSRVGQVSLGQGVLDDPGAFQKFQASQDGLSSALSRLLVVSEAYPALTATQGFRDLQVQLEGTENRITVERQRYNETARDFNTRRDSFPTVLVAGLFGSRFPSKPYFEATAGADVAPAVRF
jgi:LemA protein